MSAAKFAFFKMAKRKKPTCYSVKRGRIPGIYRTWAECEAQTTGFSGAQFKGFDSREQAEEYLLAGGSPYNNTSAPLSNATSTNASSALLSRDIFEQTYEENAHKYCSC
jgi:viroplasmin and RNaseH domain-containing protein